MAKPRVIRAWTSPSSGRRFELKPVPEMLILDVWGGAGKPQPPLVLDPESIGQQMIPNVTDPDYVEALAVWETARTLQAMNLCIEFGIGKITPPADEKDLRKLARIYPDLATDRDALYSKWVYSLFATAPEMSGFIEMVFSQSTITEEGIAAAEERFRDDDQRQVGDDQQPAPLAAVDG